MPENQPRVVLLGNISPVNSLRTVEALNDVDVDELREDSSVRSLTVDEDRELVGIHRRERLDGESVTRIVLPEDVGLIEGVGTAIAVYGSDHSDDPPEWVWSNDDAVASAIADHYSRTGTECEVGIPDDWEDRYEGAAREVIDYTLNPPAPIGGGSPELDRFAELNGIDLLDAFSPRFREEFLRTNAGADFQARVMADTASTGTGSYAPANYIALTESATAPAAGDTVLTGELTTGGLGRAQATYAHTAGTTTYTLTKTFTSSDGTTRTPAKIGIFNAAAAGTLVFETPIPSPPALVSGDSLTITETVSL